LSIVGAIFAALVLAGVLGGGRVDRYGNEVDLTPVMSATSTGTAQLRQYDFQDFEGLEVVLSVSGNRSDSFEILLYNGMNDVKEYTKLPPSAKRLMSGIQAVYSGGERDGFIDEGVDLPANYRDFSFVGVSKKSARDPTRHLELYAPMHELNLDGS